MTRPPNDSHSEGMRFRHRDGTAVFTLVAQNPDIPGQWIGITDSGARTWFMPSHPAWVRVDPSTSNDTGGDR